MIPERVLFEDNIQIYSSLIIFFSGVVISLNSPFTRNNNKLSFLIYLWHSFFCYCYALFALTNTSDSIGYYRRSILGDSNFFDIIINFDLNGTRFIDSFTSIWTKHLGLSFFGTMLVYNIIGYLGLMALLASFKKLLPINSGNLKIYLLIFIFLPGASFWTGFIGKDAPIFLANSLIIYSFASQKQKTRYFLLGFLIILFTRTYMSVFILPPFLLIIFTKKNLGLTKKLLIALLCIIFLRLAFNYVESITTNFETLNDLIDFRQNQFMENTTSIDIKNMNPIMRIFSYLFRPLLLESKSIIYLLIGFENIFLLLIILKSIYNLIRNKRSTLPINFQLFIVGYLILTLTILPLITSNLGLALRQKWMILPYLIFLCFSTFNSNINMDKKQSNKTIYLEG